MLDFCGLPLSDLFGKGDADGALEMIAEVDKATVVEVNKRLAIIKKAWGGMTQAAQNVAVSAGTEKAKLSIRYNAKLETCICCSASGILSGKRISVSADKLQDGDIVYENIILPTQFTCFSCGLKLSGHQELVAAQYDGQFTERATWDPAEYHGIHVDEPEYDPMDFYDYGND